MNASGKGYQDLVQLLLNNRANPLLRNTYGDTAYDLAAQSEEAYICELLVEAEKHWVESPTRSRSGRDMTFRVHSGSCQLQNDTELRSGQQEQPPKPNHTTVIELLHENQRSGFLSSKYSSANLSRTDTRGAFSTPAGVPTSKEEVVLPTIRDAQSGQLVRGWFWLTDWKVDTKHPRVDGEEGWQYARGFDEPDVQWVAQPGGGLLGGWVRRRRWVRVRRRRLDVNFEEADKEEGGGDGGVGAEGTAATSVPDGGSDAENDYITKAKALIDGLPKSAVDEAGVEGVKQELNRYEEAIQALLSGARGREFEGLGTHIPLSNNIRPGDQSAIRQRTATTLVSAYLQHAEQLRALIDAVESGEGEEEGLSETPRHRSGLGSDRSDVSK